MLVYRKLSPDVSSTVEIAVTTGDDGAVAQQQAAKVELPIELAGIEALDDGIDAAGLVGVAGADPDTPGRVGEGAGADSAPPPPRCRATC